MRIINLRKYNLDTKYREIGSEYDKKPADNLTFFIHEYTYF